MQKQKEPVDAGAGQHTPVKRAKLSPRVRFEVFKRDNFRCVYCGATADTSDLHVDHREPVAGGGGSGDDNLVTACAACNTGKGPVLLTERRLVLPKEPRFLRCPVHRRPWSCGDNACVYGRRHLHIATCPERGCVEFALDAHAGQDFTRPPSWMEDLVVTDAGRWRRDDYDGLCGRWQDVARSIQRPWNAIVIETDLHHARPDGAGGLRAMGLAEQWGRPAGDVERMILWWDWQIPEHGL